MPAGKKYQWLEREKYSLKCTSSFLDSSASFKPVINGKLTVKTKTHIELSQLVIVSQNFTSFKV